MGGARTALFNWLFARRHGGVFVLRIEDTDVERSSQDMVEGILDGLRWLGLDWDEGPLVDGPFAPYFQSQRLDIYRAAAGRLVAEGRAYYCYCTPDELKARREAAEVSTGGWKYDRVCASLSAADVAARERAGRPRAVRFKVPEGVVRVDDLVHGPIEFDNAHIEDFVILRSDGHPTYHLSVVSDDVEMRMTHVVRGDDHISNTPKQMLLYQALGAPVPRFAHVPLILGADKKRLSKRHGATSVMEYAQQGYLPEAMFNFLALLGWSPGSGNVEVFSRDELSAVFDLGGISGGDSVFNPEKLDWFNQQHIARLAPEELTRRIRPSLEAAGLWNDEFLASRHAWFFAVARAVEAARAAAGRLRRAGRVPVRGRHRARRGRGRKAPEGRGDGRAPRGARRRVLGAGRFRHRVHGGRAARGGRGARGQGWRADPRGPRGGDREGRQPGIIRGFGAGRPAQGPPVGWLPPAA